MKKSKKLLLQRLTMATLTAANGGFYQTRMCWGSYDQWCSESCNTCRQDATCASVGEQCTVDCPHDGHIGY